MIRKKEVSEGFTLGEGNFCRSELPLLSPPLSFSLSQAENNKVLGGMEIWENRSITRGKTQEQKNEGPCAQEACGQKLG
jgi:hypothetical protein